jgi:hypothetical protein
MPGATRIEHAVEPAEEPGVRISATSTDRDIADTSVMENWR